MLRMTEIKLPLSHTESDLTAAIIKRLGIAAGDLISHAVFKRGVDARKKNAILYTYTLDVAVRDEAAILAFFKDDRAKCALRRIPRTTSSPTRRTISAPGPS